MTDAPASVATMPSAEIANVVLSMVIIVAAILALGWIYRRMHGMRGSQGRVMEVLATQALGPKERVILARVGDRQLVIGITPAQMQTLYVLDDEEVPVKAIEEPENFATRLKQALTGGLR